MNKEQALSIVIQAVQIANKRGAFELNESEQIAKAVNFFIKKEEPKEDIGGKDKPKDETK